MEFEGIRVDMDFLNEYSKNWKGKQSRPKKMCIARRACGSILLRRNNWEKFCLKN